MITTKADAATERLTPDQLAWIEAHRLACRASLRRLRRLNAEGRAAALVHAGHVRAHRPPGWERAPERLRTTLSPDALRVYDYLRYRRGFGAAEALQQATAP